MAMPAAPAPTMQMSKSARMVLAGKWSAWRYMLSSPLGQGFSSQSARHVGGAEDGRVFAQGGGGDFDTGGDRFKRE